MDTDKNLIKKLMYEVGRRPDLQSFMETLTDASDDDINTFPVPLPWFRRALFVLRDRKISERRFAEIQNKTDQMVSGGFIRDIQIVMEGFMFQWMAQDTWIKLDCSELMVREGDLIWIEKENSFVWFDSICTRIHDPKLKPNMKFLKEATRGDYKEALRLQRNSMEPNGVIELSGSTPQAQHLSQLGVRFY